MNYYNVRAINKSLVTSLDEPDQSTGDMTLPLDARTIVEYESDIIDPIEIPNPYVGLIIYCKENSKYYTVTSIEGGTSALTDPIRVKTYKEFKPDVIPDEEDLTLNSNNELQLKDRNNTNQFGYTIVREGTALSAQISTENTIYEIRNKFDLNDGTLTLPANVVLYFNGGRISNGTIVGNNTKIRADKGVMIFDEIDIQGTWDIDSAYSSWFKCFKNGYYVDLVSIYGNEKLYYYSKENCFIKASDVTQLNNNWYRTLDVEWNTTGATQLTKDSSTGLFADGNGNYYQPNDVKYEEESDKYFLMSSINRSVNTSKVVSLVEHDKSNVGYPLFRVNGGNVLYKAGQTGVCDFDFSDYLESDHDDTAHLQALINLRAKKTYIESGNYMVNTKTNLNDPDNPSGNGNALFYEGFDGSELIIDGIIKAMPNNYSDAGDIIYVTDCSNVVIHGSGRIQGDSLEHPGNNGEWGGCIVIVDSNHVKIDGLSFEYSWGDAADGTFGNRNYRIPYVDYPTVDKQHHHVWTGCKFMYCRRTGLVYELGNYVTVDACTFEGNGLVRGTPTQSAVDIEPFGHNWKVNRVWKHYVKHYTFRNNLFKNNARQIRLERCFDVDVYNNEICEGWQAIVILNNRPIGDIAGLGEPVEEDYILAEKGGVRIHDNRFQNLPMGISIDTSHQVEIYNNDFYNVASEHTTRYSNSSLFSFTSPDDEQNPKLLATEDVQIYENRFYGCGTSYFSNICKNIKIYNNIERAHVTPIYRDFWSDDKGALYNFYRLNTEESSGIEIHDNVYMADYGKQFYGLGTNGSSVSFPIPSRAPLLSNYDNGVLVTKKNVIFYNNVIDDYIGLQQYHECSDERWVLIGHKNPWDIDRLTHLNVGAVRNDDSCSIWLGDTFKSDVYGDEGYCMKGGYVAIPSYLLGLPKYENGKLAYVGKLFLEKQGDSYHDGTDGKIKFVVVNYIRRGSEESQEDYARPYETFLGGLIKGNTAVIGEQGVTIGLINDNKGWINLENQAPDMIWTKEGVCLSTNRPSKFLVTGRRMYEQDTDKHIIYDGSAWVEDTN